MTFTPPILAAFVWPQLFAAGAAAVSIPVIIHLLARRRFKRIRWAALEFLLDAEKRNRRRVRMEELILLLLRCLAMLLIALIVSRPFLRPEGLASLVGSSGRIERVFVIDDSFSMGYRGSGVAAGGDAAAGGARSAGGGAAMGHDPAGGDGTTFAHATTAIRRLIEGIRQESPEDTVTILRTSSLDEAVLTGAVLDDAGLETTLARLEGMSASEATYDLAAAADAVVRVLDEQPGLTSAAVYFVGDFQRKDWLEAAGAALGGAAAAPGGAAAGSTAATPDPSGAAAGGGTAASAHPLARLFDWGGADRELRLVLVNVGDAEASNVAITQLALASGQPVASSSARLRVQVANHSDESIDGLTLETTVGPSAQPVRTIDTIAAGQFAATEIGIDFHRPGDEAITVSKPPDALPIDDRRVLAVDVAPAVRVLVVNGEPALEAYADETHLLATALRPAGDVFSGNEVVVVDESGFDQAQLGDYHAVILANVYRVSEPQVEALERFVRTGGGLIVFAGDQVDAGLYNGALYRGGDGLLPARLADVVRAPEGGVPLTIVDRLHPVFSGLGREGDPLGVARIRFNQYYACELPDVEAAADDVGAIADADEASADSADDAGASGAADPGVPAVAARERSAASIIAAFDDEEHRPAVVERRFGRGAVVLIASSADKEWNNWADHPTFLPVMVELVSNVARSSGDDGGVRVGEPIEFDLDPSRFTADALVRSPAFPAEPETSISALPAESGGGLTLRWEHTLQSGIYQFALRTLQGGEVTKLFAVNVDAAESDLSMATQEELRDAIGQPFEYIDGLDALGGSDGAARTELWSTFLVLAMAVLMLEQGLAWWFGRRR